MTVLETAMKKASKGERINFDEAMALYLEGEILDLAQFARNLKEQKSGKNVYFNVNRHVNLTNICGSGCPLCAFACKDGAANAFVLEKDDVVTAIRETAQKTPDLTEIHMVSALHPTKDFQYYLDIVRAVKNELPQVHLKAFTPVEIVHFSKIAQCSVKEVLEQLKAAGLDSLPGGGAEILDDEIRQKICPNKATTREWIETIKTAHKLGIPTNATILYGHLETIAQRLQHLFTLRDIQDETGGFQAFVAFPFHPANTGFSNLKRGGSYEDLKFIAIARLILDNIDHIKAFWMMLTMPIAQLSLAFGVDDLDGTVEEEKIIHAAGAKTKKNITKAEIINIIAETGYIPIERDTFYQAIQRKED